jgi:RNA polymerase sigma-70 factor (ECF subfamily)
VHGQSTTQVGGSRSVDGGGSDLAVLSEARTFESVYHEHFRQVVSWIRAMGAPDADMEDIAQDVFLVVRRKLPRFREGNLAGWLYRITKFRVRNYRRLAWFRNLFSRGQSLETIEPAAIGSTPAMTLEQKEDQQAISRILNRMSDKRRETLVLFEIEGYSGLEIAALQGVPVKTVWTRLHHARKDLVAMVAELREQRRQEVGNS